MKLIPLSIKFFWIKNTQSFRGQTKVAIQENSISMLMFLFTSLPFSHSPLCLQVSCPYLNSSLNLQFVPNFIMCAFWNKVLCLHNLFIASQHILAIFWAIYSKKYKKKTILYIILLSMHDVLDTFYSSLFDFLNACGS